MRVERAATTPVHLLCRSSSMSFQSVEAESPLGYRRERRHRYRSGARPAASLGAGSSLAVSGGDYFFARARALPPLRAAFFVPDFRPADFRFVVPFFAAPAEKYLEARFSPSRRIAFSSTSCFIGR